MKTNKFKFLVLGALLTLTSCGGTNGPVYENPKDGKTSVERNTNRSQILADQLWKNFYDEETNASLEYFPYNDGDYGEQFASVWHYTSVLSLYIRLCQITKGTSEYDKNLEKLNTIVEGIEYYREKRADGNRVYSVNRGIKPNSVMPGPNTNVYDDNEWIAREFLNAYDLTGNNEYLTKCKELVSYILVKGWDYTINKDTGKEWGGIYWGPYYTSKHTCSNAPIVSTLIRLSALDSSTKIGAEGKERTYLQWAKDVYDFSYATFRRSDDVYGDMIGTYREDPLDPFITTSHGTLDETGYTYNSGTMISAGAYLYKTTKEEKYLNEAKATAKASFSFFADPTLLEGYVQFPVSTTLWFNLTLFQGYIDLFNVDKTDSSFLDDIQKSIDFSYNNYLYEKELPVNWILGWQYGLDKDNYHDVMDVASNAETYALLAQFEGAKNV